MNIFHNNQDNDEEDIGFAITILGTMAVVICIEVIFYANEDQDEERDAIEEELALIDLASQLHGIHLALKPGRGYRMFGRLQKDPSILTRILQFFTG